MNPDNYKPHGPVPQPPATEPVDPVVQEAADREARIEYLKSLRPPKEGKPKWVKVVLIIVVLAVLIGGAVAAYLLTAKKDEPKLKTTPRAQSSETEVTETTTVVEATESFSSNLYGLTIDHPEKWEAAEDEGRVVITSPATKLTDGSGQSITGQIVISIGAKGQNLTAFDAGNATAVLDSEKLTYKQPTSVQRAQTYLSFAQYAATTATGAVDALYVTGDYGYLKGQAIPKVDMVNLDPLLSVTFLKCTDVSCATAAPTSIASTAWTKPAFATPIKSTIESLAIN